MSVTPIKPTHKAIQAYYDELQGYANKTCRTKAP